LRENFLDSKWVRRKVEVLVHSSLLVMVEAFYLDGNGKMG
jgi:hypothetical protein